MISIRLRLGVATVLIHDCVCGVRVFYEWLSWLSVPQKYRKILVSFQFQFRLDLTPPPAASCTFAQSCRSSATAAGLDYKSPGVGKVCIIGPENRCLVLRASHTRNQSCERLSQILQMRLTVVR